MLENQKLEMLIKLSICLSVINSCTEQINIITFCCSEKFLLWLELTEFKSVNPSLTSGFIPLGMEMFSKDRGSPRRGWTRKLDYKNMGNELIPIWKFARFSKCYLKLEIGLLIFWVICHIISLELSFSNFSGYIVLFLQKQKPNVEVFLGNSRKKLTSKISDHVLHV